MSKYIRTKSGVYEVTKDTKGTKFIVMGKRKTLLDYGTFITRDDDIINQSETIEELCDLYIDEETQTIFHKHNGYVINWKTNMVYSLKALSESYHSVKGAIYTDEGLIYVAKMKDNGDLELI